MSRSRLKLLSRSETKDIHDASLQILENPGLRIPSKRALDILKMAGANVDYEKNRATIPEDIVREALRRAPKTLKYCARNPKNNLLLNKKETYFTTDAYSVFIRDSKTGQRRSSTNEDLAQWAILSDYLPQIHDIWTSMVPNDIPESMQRIVAILTCLDNSEKHVEGMALSAREAQYEIEIAAAIVGDRETLKKKPIFSAIQCPIAPLGYEKGLIEGVIEFAKAGIPVVPLAMPLAGETGPVTIAGTLVVNNAEVLGSIVISEFANPGAPVLYAGDPSGIDLMTGAFVISPEGVLINSALTSLAHYYGLPSLITGGCSDSKIPDAQAAYERTLGLVTTLLTGPDIICGLGGLEGANVMCPELLLIDNEIVEEALRIARGFEVDDATLAVDVIRGVGPGGHFLSQKHTVDHLKNEYWIPKISNRDPYETWIKKGAKDIVQIAKEKIEEILSRHKPDPIPLDIRQEISQIIKKCESEFLKRKH